MSQAAVPKYVGQQFSDAPPGHRFSLYFPMWSGEPKWRRPDDDAKREALGNVRQLRGEANIQLKALVERQEAIARTLGDNVLSVRAKSTSPFMTGIGMEHPVENGFAFLNPYGLPYLPGASVKGVLRNVAERLALGLISEDRKGWDPLAVWWLFGFEEGSAYLAKADKKLPDVLREEAGRWREAYEQWLQSESWDEKEARVLVARALGCREEELQEWPRERLAEVLRHLGRIDTQKPDVEQSMNPQKFRLQGTLAFWDVYVQPANDRLDIDILTPHYGHYYQDGEPPHDAGKPNPNPFLVVPPGSRFVFYVECLRPGRLPERLRKEWKTLISAVLDEAFQWFGFGAKTAVGYGQLCIDDGREESPAFIAGEAERWENAVVRLDPGSGTLTATRGKETARASAETALKIQQSLDEASAQRLKKKKELAGVTVEVRRSGNQIELCKILGSSR